ncbi:MAG: HAD-IC family P-type ATPase [Candidatus Paceibacterota bacterium]
MSNIETNKAFWCLKKEDVFKDLKTRESGLTPKEVEERQKEIGLNSFSKEKRFSKFKILFNQFKSPLIFILIIAGVVTLIVQEWVDSGVIFLAIFVNAALGFYQENRAENALERLKSYIKERARVIRDGEEHEIDAKQIVPGDLIHLSYGSRIPADARIISAKNFTVDEAILTGESLPVNKNTEIISEGASLPERSNMVFGGTLVVEGYAVAVVTKTGTNTEIGKIAKIVSETERGKTPLQKAVTKLAWVITAGAILLITALFFVGLSQGQPLFEMFLISSAVAVGAIPEALPISLTIILAVGVEQLAKRKGIMRSLSAAETLGSTSVIMTDKTGTLTQADLSLINIASTEEILEDKIKDIGKRKTLDQDHQNILKLAMTNADVLIENPKENPKDWRIVGKPLESHIVRLAGKYGINAIDLKQKEHYHSVLSFNSVNKFSAAHVKKSKNFPNPIDNGKDFYAILGAPDILLERSSLDKDSFIKIKNKIDKMSGEGKRLLGLAVVEAPSSDDPEMISPDIIKNITFVGLFAFFDPIRPGVPGAIKKMEESGVQVVMATGDLKGTAMSIAKEIGWDINEGNVLTGEELRQISDEELLENIDNIKIYARVTPEDKMRVGKLFQSRGEIVGMTGDGVNDAPSLKAVDIGIAVGSGSDVAKEVSDLVILDDNFETIVAAIEEGRRILNNIRKSFIYLVSNSFDEIILIGGSIFMGLSLPLTALQIIWVNFFTGSLPALSYAFDDFIDKKHVTSRSSKNIIDREVKALTLGVGIVTSAFLLGLYWFLMKMNIPEIEAKTFLFACFASYILFISFSFRSLKKSIFAYNIFSNKFLNYSVLIGLTLTAITIYIPFLQEIFGTVALSASWLVWLALWTVMNILLVETAKWIYRND